MGSWCMSSGRRSNEQRARRSPELVGGHCRCGVKASQSPNTCPLEAERQCCLDSVLEYSTMALPSA